MTEQAPDFAAMTPAEIETWIDTHPGELFTALGEPTPAAFRLYPISLYGEDEATVEVTIRMSPAALQHIDMATTAMPGDRRAGFIRFAVDQHIRAVLAARPKKPIDMGSLVFDPPAIGDAE